jgi:uncharacterized protein (TIGR03437 family)
MKRRCILGLLSWLAFSVRASGQVGIISTSTPGSQFPETPLRQKAQLVESYGELPLDFEANRGQADESVKFISRGGAYGLYLTDEEAVLALHKGGCGERTAAEAGQTPSSARLPGLPRGAAACAQQTDVVRMRLAKASHGGPAPTGEEQLPGTANYFIGNDPAKWHTGVPTYAKVRYRDVYPGVDLVYYGNQRQLEYDFAVAPGADPKPIRLEFAGAKALRVGVDGGLVVTAGGGEIAFHKPAVYQVVNGQRRVIEGRFALLGGHTVGFRLGSYDRGKLLVIDPVLVYSTYLGGSDFFGDYANAIAVDASGNAYIAGATYSKDFPVSSGAFQNTNNAYGNSATSAFVSKLNPGGTALVYSTYLGGNPSSICNAYSCVYKGASAQALAIDSQGNAYVAGEAYSVDFPLTKGAFQAFNSLYGGNAFVTKLNATGTALVYSTYLGGTSNDGANALAVDGSGNAYVAGAAASGDFSVTMGAFQTVNKAPNGSSNAFVTKLNASGTALVYSTYLGGSSKGEANALTVDPSGNAYVAGTTGGTDFPVTVAAFQSTNNAAAHGGTNGFVAKLNATGTGLVFATYLGGSGQDYASGLAVDGEGDAHVVGWTSSMDFPVTAGAVQRNNKAGDASNAFVTKLNATGTGLVYSTYLGGSGAILPFGDFATAVAVDSGGNAYVVGETYSIDFPVTIGAFQSTNTAAADQGYTAFVAKLNASGTALMYSTYLGGSASSEANALAVDGGGNAYVVGSTSAFDFPVTTGAFQMSDPGYQPAFVTKLDLNAPLPAPSITSGGIVPVDSIVNTIQPGEWVSIFGTNLAGSTATWNGDFPTSLGGTSVTINGKSAYLSFVSPTQINLQAPTDTATGSVPVVVTTSGGTATSTVTLAQFGPSFLLLDSKHVAGIILRSNGSGAYGGGTYDIIGPTGNSLGYPTVAAKVGDSVVLFAVGLGPTNPVVPAGQAFSGAASTTNAVSLLINKFSAAPSFAGLSSAGLYQINLTVPAGLGTGDVSLVATVGGVQTPAGVVISLQ